MCAHLTPAVLRKRHVAVPRDATGRVQARRIPPRWNPPLPLAPCPPPPASSSSSFRRAETWIEELGVECLDIGVYTEVSM